MKTSIILLLILLAATACAPQQTLVPVVNPNPIPVTGTTPVATGIPAVTSVPPCTCPTGPVTPPQPGVVQPDHIVCNCPVMLGTPPAPTTGVGSTPQAVPAGGVTLSDNGEIFLLHPGESFLLNLGMDTFDWTVTIDDQNILSMKRGVMVIRGAQGIYQADNPGQAVLSAVGDPLCRNSTPQCMSPSVLFTITVIVQ